MQPDVRAGKEGPGFNHWPHFNPAPTGSPGPFGCLILKYDSSLRHYMFKVTKVTYYLYLGLRA